MPRGNNNNLTPVTELTSEQRTALAKKANLASQKAKREKKEAKQRLSILLELPISDPKARETLKAMGISPKDFNNRTLLDIVLFRQAIKGDVSAIKYFDEKTGESPMLKIREEELLLKQKNQTSETDDTTTEIEFTIISKKD